MNPAHIYGNAGDCGCEKCQREPVVGDTFAHNEVWSCIGTGGNCTAWHRFVDGSVAPSPAWLITRDSDGLAPRYREQGAVILSLEGPDGSIWLAAKCKSVPAACTLAARFTGAM